MGLDPMLHRLNIQLQADRIFTIFNAYKYRATRKASDMSYNIG